MAKRSTKKGDREPIVIHESESESSEAGDDDDEEEEGGEDDAEYEVEEILNWKMGDKGKQRYFFIKWKGFDDSYNTWEPEENLEGSADLVVEYLRKNKRKPEGTTTSNKKQQQSSSSRFKLPEDSDAEIDAGTPSGRGETSSSKKKASATTTATTTTATTTTAAAASASKDERKVRKGFANVVPPSAGSGRHSSMSPDQRKRKSDQTVDSFNKKSKTISSPSDDEDNQQPLITFSKTKEENDQNGLNGVKQQAYNRLIESREEDEEKEKEDGGRDYDDDEMTGERNVTTNTATAMEDDSDLRYLSEAQLNKELMNKRSWEALVDGVVNIERSDEGQLMVQIRWKDGKESIHDNSTVNKKCPQAVIKFFESKLSFVEEELEEVVE